MKKIYFATISTALMVMAAACSSDNVEPTDNATVRFSVNLGDIDSRANNGDGTTVDQLIFAVYDSNGNELTQLRQEDIDVTDRQALVTTSVARGQDYTFVFWAQKLDTHTTTPPTSRTSWSTMTVRPTTRHATRSPRRWR